MPIEEWVAAGFALGLLLRFVCQGIGAILGLLGAVVRAV